MDTERTKEDPADARGDPVIGRDWTGSGRRAPSRGWRPPGLGWRWGRLGWSGRLCWLRPSGFLRLIWFFRHDGRDLREKQQGSKSKSG
jgi:hypothetical protein